VPWIPLFKNTPKPTAKKIRKKKKREREKKIMTTAIPESKQRVRRKRSYGGEPDLEKKETRDSRLQ
jgi:hypothetical protein